MNQTEIGKFIAKCRREKNLTQAQLAQMLNITDRAVSKWETGKSMPDYSIMPRLCEILEISANELLDGAKNNAESCKEKAAVSSSAAPERKNETPAPKNKLVSIIFSAVLLIGITVCLICNIAVSGALTWALIPVSSIAFAWAVFFPCAALGKRGIIPSLISLSFFIFPYLFLLSELTETKGVFSIGRAVSAASIVFFWAVAAVFKRIGKTRKLYALGTAFLMAVPLLLVINLILAKMINEPFFDVWDMLSLFLLLIFAAVSFVSEKRN